MIGLLRSRVLEICEPFTEDVRTLLYSEETFDLVIAVEVLEHIPRSRSRLDGGSACVETEGLCDNCSPGEITYSDAPLRF